MAWAIARGERWGRLGRWLLRIRVRLLIINVVVVAVPVVGIAFARMHERELLVALERDMIHQALLVRAMVLADPAGPRLADRAPALRAAARDTRTRIGLLDADGVVVADSHAGGPPEGAEAGAPSLLGRDGPTHAPVAPGPVELPSRREVRRALAGRYGAATRIWAQQERVYLFVAVPIVLERAGAGPARNESGAPGASESIGGATDADPPRVIGVVYVTRSTQPVKLQLYRLRSWLVRILIVSIAVTAVLSLFLAATIARPLTRLTRIAQRIAAGDRREPLALARRDEIGDLARAVDQMTRELDRRARDQRELAADLGHELKTPLTGIRASAELLRDGAADDPAARDRFLAITLDDAARLDRMVGRLLDLSRVEFDDAAVEDVDLAAVARAVAAAAPPGATVRVDAAAAVRARVRRRALAVAVENLVANAVRHADPGTAVTVRCTADAAGARLAVHNVGAAVSPAVAARVWDRFFTTCADRGGSGLGLAIVRSVAASHGGHVGVTSDAAGTTFWIRLPAPA